MGRDAFAPEVAILSMTPHPEGHPEKLRSDSYLW
jgi:hypothetical protein